MIFTYGLTALVLIAAYLILSLFPDIKSLSDNGRIAVWAASAFVLSVVLSRPAYSLWLSFDYWLEPWRVERS